MSLGIVLHLFEELDELSVRIFDFWWPDWKIQSEKAIRFYFLWFTAIFNDINHSTEVFFSHLSSWRQTQSPLKKVFTHRSSTDTGTFKHWLKMHGFPNGSGVDILQLQASNAPWEGFLHPTSRSFRWCYKRSYSRRLQWGLRHNGEVDDTTKTCFTWTKHGLRVYKAW